VTSGGYLTVFSEGKVLFSFHYKMTDVTIGIVARFSNETKLLYNENLTVDCPLVQSYLILQLKPTYRTISYHSKITNCLRLLQVKSYPTTLRTCFWVDAPVCRWKYGCGFSFGKHYSRCFAAVWQPWRLYLLLFLIHRLMINILGENNLKRGC
jgi:hypothetical protein